MVRPMTKSQEKVLLQKNNIESELQIKRNIWEDNKYLFGNVNWNKYYFYKKYKIQLETNYNEILDRILKDKII